MSAAHSIASLLPGSSCHVTLSFALVAGLPHLQGVLAIAQTLQVDMHLHVHVTHSTLILRQAFSILHARLMTHQELVWLRLLMCAC